MDQDAGLARISVDPTLCAGCGICAITSPSLFVLENGAYCATVLEPATRDPAVVAAARAAAPLCPTGAVLVDLAPA